jgi:hypothetical protein
MRRFFLPGWVNLLRTVLRFLARANTFSCGRSSSIRAATVNLAHGICDRQIQEHKSEGWQDRLAPGLGAMRLTHELLGRNGDKITERRTIGYDR